MQRIILIVFALWATTFAAMAQTTTTTHYTQYLTTADFKANIFDYSQGGEWKYKGDKPCIIDFYATWCGPCRALAPTLETLAQEYQDKLTIYKVDTDKERELAAVFGIRSIPSLLFIPVGNQPQMSQGALPREALVQIINSVLLGASTQQ